MKAQAVNGLKLLCTIALAATVAACGSMESTSMDKGSPAPKASAHGGGDLAAALASANRPAEDKARDADRKPAELMQFFGVKPGMTTVDIIALGGYITEVLSVAVGSNGKVYAQNATLLAKDIATRLELRRAPGDDDPVISGYFGTFEGVGKLRIGSTAFEESTIGRTYRVAFSRASRRAWSVEPAE